MEPKNAFGSPENVIANQSEKVILRPPVLGARISFLFVMLSVVVSIVLLLTQRHSAHYRNMMITTFLFAGTSFILFIFRITEQAVLTFKSTELMIETRTQTDYIPINSVKSFSGETFIGKKEHVRKRGGVFIFHMLDGTIKKIYVPNTELFFPIRSELTKRYKNLFNDEMAQFNVETS